MSSHAELIAAFRAGLGSGALPPGVTALDPAEAARRFDVYRNNVAHSLSRALATRYPVIERLLGPEYFTALAAVYLQAHPPRSPVLLAFGAEFPDFLASFPPLTALPYLRDVARIEVARGRAYHAADAAPVTGDRLARAGNAPEVARLTLHPSVECIASAHAARSIWAANQPGAGPMRAIDATRPETSLVLRDPADRVLVLPLGAGDAAMFLALAEGAPLLAAAARGAVPRDPEHDPGALLALLARAGAITDITIDTEESR